jgi:Tfp pilus assembly protein PilO
MKPALLVGAIALAFVGAIGYHSIYLPQQAEVASIQTQIAQEQATQDTQAQVAALLAQFEQYRNGRLPLEPNPSWLVQEAASLGQKAGVELTTITQEAPQPLGRLTRVAVSLRVLASYHQLGKFLDEIERSDHFIRVERVELSPETEKGARVPAQVVLSSVALPSVTGLLSGGPSL